MELSLKFDNESETTLQAQIFDQVRKYILTGRLRPGTMLPSTRSFAEQFHVSRNTVTLSYERLAAEGYIETKGKAGTFVSKELPDNLFHPGGQGSEIAGPNAARIEKAAAPSPLMCFAGYSAGTFDRRRPTFDFWVGRSEPNIFPISAWRRILIRKLTSSKGNLTEYGDPAGLRELRVAVANLLARSRGMQVSADQVIVTSGSQDGLNLLCRLVNRDHFPFFIENPCYMGAAHLFQSLGASLFPIPVDENGLIVDNLPRNKGGIVFVTPSHQYPTGATLSLDRRIHLLRWAESTNSFIIEDDYDSDFRYDGPPLTALAGLDESRRVFYLGTFSKSLGAGLRLGFAVVPKAHAEAARIVKSQMNQGQPWLDQATLLEFLESGLYERHLRRARNLYKERRDCLKACLDKCFGAADISGESGGLHIVWRLPEGSPPAHVIEQEARSRGVGVYTLRSGGAYDFDSSTSNDALVLGYSSLARHDIEQAVGILHQLLREVRDKDSPHKFHPNISRQKEADLVS